MDFLVVLSVVAGVIVVVTICGAVDAPVLVVVGSASAALPVVTTVSILSSMLVVVGFSAAHIFVTRRTVVCGIELVSVHKLSPLCRYPDDDWFGP